MVVGSQARILYADAEGRIRIAEAFNKAIRDGRVSAPVILGRDHHDVSGTDSPYRETSNIYDGSSFTADMAVQNVIGDSFRGATWVSLHNGGGVGWGEVINGGFGMVLDGSDEAHERLHSMLHWDVNNGIARRSWARNDEAIFAIKRAMEVEPKLKVTLPNIAGDKLVSRFF
jgi:urocanate hydratase